MDARTKGSLFKGAGLPLILCAVMAASVSASATAGPSLCNSGWRHHGAPTQGDPAELRAIGFVPGTKAAWAVGLYWNDLGLEGTLAERFDGHQWQIVASPNPGSDPDELAAVSADSSTDAWAVGFTSNIDLTGGALIEHWDGSRWRIVRGARLPRHQFAGLGGVVALSPVDVWVVGSYHDGRSTLIEHWDGSEWSIVPSPSPGTDLNGLGGVTALAEGGIWAAGSTTDVDAPSQTLVERWDGTAWSVIPSANGPGSNGLTAIAGMASGKILWAVGGRTRGTRTVPLVEYWGGRDWQVVPTPDTGKSYSALVSLAFYSSNDVVAVGFSEDANLNPWALIERYSFKWKIERPAPDPSHDSILLGVAAAPLGTMWAVGNRGSSTLVEVNCYA
jgi:hypothetical protein